MKIMLIIYKMWHRIDSHKIDDTEKMTKLYKDKPLIDVTFCFIDAICSNIDVTILMIGHHQYEDAFFYQCSIYNGIYKILILINKKVVVCVGRQIFAKCDHRLIIYKISLRNVSTGLIKTIKMRFTNNFCN